MIDDCHQCEKEVLSHVSLVWSCVVYMYIVSKLLYSCVEGRGEKGLEETMSCTAQDIEQCPSFWRGRKREGRGERGTLHLSSIPC